MTVSRINDAPSHPDHGPHEVACIYCGACGGTHVSVHPLGVTPEIMECPCGVVGRCEMISEREARTISRLRDLDDRVTRLEAGHVVVE